MRAILCPLISGAALLASTASGHAGTKQPRHLEPSAPRMVAVSDAAQPPVILTGELQATLIVLPPEEKVATVFGGDTVNWVFDGGHIASRFISVKPKAPGVTTDLHIVSDHGNEYSLALREVSGTADMHFDSKVTITPGDPAGKQRLESLPVFVPAAELDRARADAAAAKAGEEAVLKAETVKAEQYRSQYPGTLKFDYRWDRKKGDELGLEQVWHDDRFTYLRGHFQETPALYELKDGKPSLVNFDFSDGLYTVPKEVGSGYLAIGKKKVTFDRIAEAK